MRIKNADQIHARDSMDDRKGGCGYWGVCFGAGFECPCAAQAQPFSQETWDSIQADKVKQMRQAELEMNMQIGYDPLAWREDNGIEPDEDDDDIEDIDFEEE